MVSVNINRIFPPSFAHYMIKKHADEEGEIMPKTKLNIEVGDRIRQMREYQRLSREKVAESANISTQFLADIERGNKSMTAATIIGIAEALGVSTDYLLLGRKLSEDDGSKLRVLMSTLPPDRRQLAEEMMLLFLQAVRR